MDQGIPTADLGGTPLTPAQLAEIPAFADVRPQIWEKFPGAVAKQTYRAGEFLFHEGEHGTTPITQNFQFGTPTPTWYSLSSPECNDFAP